MTQLLAVLEQRCALAFRGKGAVEVLEDYQRWRVPFRPSYCSPKRTSIYPNGIPVPSTSIYPNGIPVPSFVPSSDLQAFVLVVRESGYGCVNTSETQFRGLSR